MDNAASDAVARDNIAIEGTGKVADAAPNGIVIWVVAGRASVGGLGILSAGIVFIARLPRRHG